MKLFINCDSSLSLESQKNISFDSVKEDEDFKQIYNDLNKYESIIIYFPDLLASKFKSKEESVQYIMYNICELFSKVYSETSEYALDYLGKFYNKTLIVLKEIPILPQDLSGQNYQFFDYYDNYKVISQAINNENQINENLDINLSEFVIYNIE